MVRARLARARADVVAVLADVRRARGDGGLPAAADVVWSWLAGARWETTGVTCRAATAASSMTSSDG
jgi:hypothetical protein